MGMEIAPFSQTKTPVPRLPVLPTLFAASPQSRAGVERRALWFSSPRWAEGQSGIFLSRSQARWLGHLAGLLFGTRGRGGAKEDRLSSRPSAPSPGLSGESSSSWPPPARTLSPNSLDSQSPQGHPRKLQATKRWLCGDQAPPGHRVQGDRGGAAAAGAGRARSRPGGGPGSRPGRRAPAADGVGPRARAGRRERGRVLTLSPPREPEPPHYLRPPGPPRQPRPPARRLGLLPQAVPAVAQKASSLIAVALYGLFSPALQTPETVSGSATFRGSE